MDEVGGTTGQFFDPIEPLMSESYATQRNATPSLEWRRASAIASAEPTAASAGRVYFHRVDGLLGRSWL